jgi:glycerol-3-phosphate dehydrogenase
MPINHPQDVIILGGGINGVGLVHDLVSRGCRNVTLVEKNSLASGTSSKSTKLIHGGLRYLQYPKQINLVRECLAERNLLLNLAQDVVKPIEILFPIEKGSLFQGIKIKAGLLLYDFLAKDSVLASHRLISPTEYRQIAKIIDTEKIDKIYSYWDAQTNDSKLVKKIANLAKKHGAKISEYCEAKSLRYKEGLWHVDLQKNGQKLELKAQVVVNLMGAWSNDFLVSQGIKPSHKGIKNKGVHLLFADMGLKRGVILHNKSDNRIFFVLPWESKTLVGTTESIFEGSCDSLTVEQKDVEYLLAACKHYFRNPLKKSDVIDAFAGLRWGVEQDTSSLSSHSRDSVVGEIKRPGALLLTLYGGKLTTYRKQAELIGDRITKFLQRKEKSKTSLPHMWK